MQPHSAATPRDSQHLRHELFSTLTVIQSQAHLLQRHLRRMDGLVDGDRERLEVGLTVILTSVHELGAKIDRLPAISTPSDSV
jgi:hypothetical protein